MTTFFNQRPPTHARLVTRLRAPVVVSDPNVIHSRRLILRPLMETDRDAFASLLADCRDSFTDFFPLHRPAESDEQAFERQAALSHGALATGRAWRRVICIPGGPIIGSINLNDISDRTPRSAELNFWLAPRYQSRGFAAEAVAAALGQAFRVAPIGLGLRRIWGYVAPDNAPCLKLINRLGFTRDARSLPVQLNLAGRWTTHHVYQTTAPAMVVPAHATPLRIVAA